jgi:protein TonB
VKTVIGQDGHVEGLEVVSGPPMLRQAALDAVKQWVFKPYLLNGAAIEVSTVVRVTFELRFQSTTAPAKP